MKGTLAAAIARILLSAVLAVSVTGASTAMAAASTPVVVAATPLVVAAAPLVVASTSAALAEPVALLRHSAVLSAGVAAADYYRATTAHTAVLPTNGWSWSTYAEGLLSLYRQSGEGRYLSDELALGRATGWQIASTWPERDPNDLKAGQNYLQLSSLDPSVDLRPMDAAMADDLTGLAPARYDWIDALFMGLPDWSLWSTRTGDSAYLRKLDTLYLWTRDQGGTSARCKGKVVSQPGLYDAAYGLWYRDCRYVGAVDGNGRPVFWSRGNGWVIAAMATVLATLPPGDAEAGKYSAMLQAMASHLLPLQGSDGLWRSNLTDAAQYPDPETSGTALISYALAVGIPPASWTRPPTCLPSRWPGGD